MNLCPCGELPIIVDLPGQWAFVQCPKCGKSTKIYFETSGDAKKAAVKEWNQTQEDGNETA